jgi:hypothetical protein
MIRTQNKLTLRALSLHAGREPTHLGDKNNSRLRRGPRTDSQTGGTRPRTMLKLAVELDAARLDVLARGPSLERIPRCDPVVPLRMMRAAGKIVAPGLVRRTMGTRL